MFVASACSNHSAALFRMTYMVPIEPPWTGELVAGTLVASACSTRSAARYRMTYVVPIEPPLEGVLVVAVLVASTCSNRSAARYCTLLGKNVGLVASACTNRPARRYRVTFAVPIEPALHGALAAAAKVASACSNRTAALCRRPFVITDRLKDHSAGCWSLGFRMTSTLDASGIWSRDVVGRSCR